MRKARKVSVLITLAAARLTFISCISSSSPSGLGRGRRLAAALVTLTQKLIGCGLVRLEMLFPFFFFFFNVG